MISDFRALINASAKKFRNRTAFLVRETNTSYRKISYGELRSRYYALCSSFISMGLKDKYIAVVGKNSYEWTLSYLAAATVGIVVPLDKELSVEDMANFVDYADCAAVCAQAKYIKGLSEASVKCKKFMSFDEIDTVYSAGDADKKSEVDSINIGKDEMKILIFTSGTTGSAKGVCLSQTNILANIRSTVSIVKIKKSDRTLSILPLHHTYECTLNCILMLSRGACITYADSIMKVAKNIVEYSPTVLVVVPALLKVLDRKVTSSVKEKCPQAYKNRFETMPFAMAMKSLPSLVKNIICSKVKNNLGGKLRLFIVGAADLDPSIVEDFSSLNIRALQGYGLTECSPLLAGNSDFYFNPKSTGIAIPGVELKIDSPNYEGVGEVFTRGENVMLGYFKDKEGTDRVFDGGWFHTGDLGRMDADGALYITGRSKNVIVTENGKNIYPEELEAKLSVYPEVEDVLVLASEERGKVEVKAKIFPNVEFLKKMLGRVPSPSDILAAINKIVKDINQKMPSYKRINILEILDKTLEKTTTKKIKRFGNNVAG